MAAGERFLYDLSKSALFQSLTKEKEILFWQEVLEDCVRNEQVVRELQAIAEEAVEAKRKNWLGVFGAYPGSILHGAVRMLETYLPLLERLCQIARDSGYRFRSKGFTRFFTMVRDELNDEYLHSVKQYLKDLRFDGGVMISGRLGEGNELSGHVLRKPKGRKTRWITRMIGPKTPSFSFSIDGKDETGLRALGDLRDRGINFAANAMAQSAEHVENFFKILRNETGFYLACLNLKEKLASIGEAVCFPVPQAPGSRVLECSGLYHVCLSLVAGKKSKGNEIHANGKNLAIITGVNEGGKSTFLRSIGIAQLMMQAGIFVSATTFHASIQRAVITHFRRKEDRDMGSGKFDEELKRM
ncbi:MAG: DNA mismatch repair protein MutS, partial [Rectinema sp.]|nr:DNA mismatch repair protein MutS [Rectinema sp.]